MRKSVGMGLIITAIGGSVVGAAMAQSFASGAVQPADEIVLNPAPGLTGIEAAILHGDLDADGHYVLRVRFDPGATSAPHTHDQARYITVLDGTWHFATGADASCATSTGLEAGSFAYLPAGVPHFDGSCSDTATTVQISGQGPVHTHYLEAQK